MKKEKMNIDKQKLTPAMRQYVEIKEANPDYLLFYRMGDFYELFFDDAIVVSSVLGIQQTSRGKMGDEKIPMCGVPFHAYESYMVRLVKAGYKIAICEQMESPQEAKKRGAAALVKREVVRLVSAGTLTEDTLLPAKRHNDIMALTLQKDDFGLAWADLSTGEFYTQQTPKANLFTVLSSVAVSELLIAQSLVEQFPPIQAMMDIGTVLPDEKFHFLRAKDQMQRFFDVADLTVFGALSAAEITSAGVLLDYVLLTQKEGTPRFNHPKKLNSAQYMEIDMATRRSLELVYPLSGDKKARSLLDIIDETTTNAGGRLLSSVLMTPLMDIDAVRARQSKIDYFVQNPTVLGKIKALLKGVPDMQRALSRLAIGRGGPRDLVALKSGLKLLPDIRQALDNGLMGDALAKDVADLGQYADLVAELESAVEEKKDEPLPLLAREGHFIRQGYDATLDELLALSKDSTSVMAQLQQRYAAQTNIPNLKIASNNIIGYYVEIPLKSEPVIINNWGHLFVHKQSLLNCARFTTAELANIEQQIAQSAERALNRELYLFDILKNRVLALSDDIVRTALALAKIDVAATLASIALRYHWVCPTMTTGYDFDIQNGRHPVVEVALHKNNQEFIPNTCILQDNQKVWLLTGPNMAGKSTFLRQNALIVILAQIGSFVPAEKAVIGLVDKVFSRVGASDDLARGQSTFMVEMLEVATILNGATDRSLVILDEVGRGTATFDGLSIALAVLEYLCQHNLSRALFATHYHELTQMTQDLPMVAPYTIRIKQWQGDVVFMHEVIAGISEHSYGIYVARLAGVPAAVIGRAQFLLTHLESKHAPALTDLPLFEKAQEKQAPSAIEKQVQELDIDALSPRQALDVLYQLKEQLKGQHG